MTWRQIWQCQAVAAALQAVAHAVHQAAAQQVHQHQVHQVVINNNQHLSLGDWPKYVAGAH